MFESQCIFPLTANRWVIDESEGLKEIASPMNDNEGI